jgi:hypothetical protein
MSSRKGSSYFFFSFLTLDLHAKHVLTPVDLSTSLVLLQKWHLEIESFIMFIK